MFRPSAHFLESIACLVAGALCTAPLARGEESAVPSAHVLGARVGRTERGVPRVVIETDRPVPFLTVELAQGNGFDVHLLGTDTTSVPAASSGADAVVSSLELRPGPSGVIARVTLAGERRTGRAFALESPSRVVLDLPKLTDLEQGPPDAVAASAGNGASPAATTNPPKPAKRGASSKPAPAAPATTTSTSPAKSPAPKSPKLASPATDSAVAHDSATASAPAMTDEPAVAGTDTAAAASADKPAAPAAPSPATGPTDKAAAALTDKEMSDVVAWVRDLRAALDSIRKSGDAGERAHAQRDLASLLRARGLYAEAEKALLGAARNDASDSAAAAADSLEIAELRLARGDAHGALAVASALGGSRLTTSGRVRLARVLLETDQPDAVEGILAPVLASTDGASKAQASLLLARSHWDRGEAAKALPLAVELVAAPATPAEILPRALILEADCLCALDRSAEAGGLYDRASKLDLTTDEASWASLQLANLARRGGRLDEARERYEATKKRWPESFYASQADWFLRFDDRLRAVHEADPGRKSG
ncbi:MAG: tetratricopeptide repeat protein [bacterium]